MVSDERGNRFKRSPRQDSQKRALSGRIGRVQVGAGSDQDGDGLGIALAGRKEPRRVSLAIPLFDVGFCLYRRLQQRDRAPARQFQHAHFAGRRRACTRARHEVLESRAAPTSA
jgi:hypothetical protein